MNLFLQNEFFLQNEIFLQNDFFLQNEFFFLQNDISSKGIYLTISFEKKKKNFLRKNIVFFKNAHIFFLKM